MFVAPSYPTLQPHGLGLTRLFCPWDSPGKNTGVGYHFLLQGIFPTQKSNPGLLHCQADSIPTGPPGELSQKFSPNPLASICRASGFPYKEAYKWQNRGASAWGCWEMRGAGGTCQRSIKPRQSPPCCHCKLS